MRSEDRPGPGAQTKTGWRQELWPVIDFICPIRTLGFTSLSAPKEISLILFSAELIVITRPVSRLTISQPGSVEIAGEES